MPNNYWLNGIQSKNMEKILVLILVFVGFFSCDDALTSQKKNADGGATLIAEQNRLEETKKDGFTAKEDKLSNNNTDQKEKLGIDKKQVIHGIKEEGRFRMYSQVAGNGEGYYNGLPKVEILNEQKKVIKTIDVLNNTSLFSNEKTEFQFNKNQGDNYFIVNLDQAQSILKLVNTSLFPKPEVIPELLLEVAYEIQNGVLLCQYTYLVLEPEGFDLFGAKSEVVMINETGVEMGRVIVNGPLNHNGITKNHKVLFLTTGGDINEDAFHPTAFWVFDIEKEAIIHSRFEKNGECIDGGQAVENKGVMYIREICSSRKSTVELNIFDYSNNKIYSMENFSECKGGGFQIFEEYFLCYSKDNIEQRFYYTKDFASSNLVK